MLRLDALPYRILSRTVEEDTGFDTDCWLCDLSVNDWGYARLRWPSGTSGKVVVHKITFELFVGKVPDGLELDHLCRVPNCIRPIHLEPVTKRENSRRSSGPQVAAQRQLIKTHCPKSHEYTDENTWVNNRGFRACKRCHADREILRYHRLKGQASA